ncbi:MAG: 50S ribosomal protein L4 [Actinomycetes bacterium]
MSTVDVRSTEGKVVGTAELPEEIFGIEPNVPVMHQVVTAQLAHARAGTHKAKTRAEVAGGGAKPWRQKGTGRARQGSTRAPHWRGGGVAHGPKPRDYTQRTPKKMVRLAIRSALSDRAAESRVHVIDAWGFEPPSTKRAIAALEALGLRERGQRQARLAIVLDRTERETWLSFRNLGERVRIVLPEEINTYDVLLCDHIVFSTATLATTVARLGSGTAEEA